MGVYKNLEKIQFQVELDRSVDSERNLYSFYFKNTRDDFIGIPLPDFSPKVKESFSEKYLETLICSIFDEHAPHYSVHNQCYISAVLTKKEMNEVSKLITEEYAKKVKNVISDFSSAIFEYSYFDDRVFVKVLDNQSLGLEFDKNARKNEYDFIMRLLGFAYYKDGKYVAEDWDLELEEAYEDAQNCKFDIRLAKK